MSEQSHMPDDKKKPRKRISAYRKLRRTLSKTVLRTPHVWLRHRLLREADVLFAGYPRSGTTWSRFTLFEILTGREAGFAAVDSAIRPINEGIGPPLLPGNGRLIGTHEHYRKEYKRAIYLVRDARDVALSEFAYTSALEFFHGDLDQFLTTFLCGKISAFGPWQRHIGSWLDSPLAGTPNLLVIRFEDLRRSPFAGFRRMAEFLGVKPDAQLIQRAIANNTLDKMKTKERIEPRLAPLKGEFVRSGSVQGWRSKLSPSQLQFIEQHAGSVLLRLGYPLSGDAVGEESSVDPVLQVSTNLS